MKKLLTLLLTLLMPGSLDYAMGQVPAAPSVLKVVPDYGADNMKLTWIDNSTNETGFRIERKFGGAAFAPVGTTAANTTEYSDDIEPDTEYTYRVFAFNDNGDSESSSNECVNNLAVKWPLHSGNHEMLNGYQDGAPANLWGFHEGIGIQGDGTIGQRVNASRGGVIKKKFYNGLTTSDWALIVTALENGSERYDHYLFINNPS